MTKWQVIHELINQHGPGQPTPYWVMLVTGLLFVLAAFALALMVRGSDIRIVHKHPAPKVPKVEPVASVEPEPHVQAPRLTPQTSQ
jgi:hypothetical protein